MSYQNILDALYQELVCVDRAIAFLMKADGYHLAPTNGATPVNGHAVAADPDEEMESQLHNSAVRRATKRLEILSELREEQGLLVNAIESIHKLAESSGY